MPTEKRHEELERQLNPAMAADKVTWGSTVFKQRPVQQGAPEEGSYLGTQDLYLKFDGKSQSGQGKWGLALMEMLVDPMLREWVPHWVVEQYERANPCFQPVLRSMQVRAC